MKLLKFVLAALFGLGLTILIPFTTDGGLTYVKDHGKLLLFVIGIINTVVGGALSGGFFTKNGKTGFTYWLMPTFYKGSINPTRAFGALISLWNLFVILFFIEP